MKIQALSGQWRFKIDRGNTGVDERWFEEELPGQISLPGVLAAQGVGDEISAETRWIGAIANKSWFTEPENEKYGQRGNFKIPFWLQPGKYYAGAAWYQRDIEIPAEWQGRRVRLTLERPHWETRVWLDGVETGLNNSLSTPHEYDFGTMLAPGGHRLSIRVDNSLVIDIGVNSHSITDHTQGNWNGIVGRIELSTTEALWIEELQIYPDPAGKSVLVKGRLCSAAKLPGSCPVKLEAELFNGDQPARLAPVMAEADKDGVFVARYSLGDDARLWDEFNPALYRLTARLENGDAKSAVFGLREIATHGTQFTINGRKLFLRGTLECAIFPKTGHPPTDVDSWKRILHVARAHGLNHLRFHSWCPPEAAFIAADEFGFYYQIESASWANSSTTIGDGKPVDEWVYAETDRILKAFGNHPSFVLMAYGNEPGGAKHPDYLAKWVDHFKAKDARRLFTGGAGWPEIAENQFHVTPYPRIYAWGNGLASRINALPPETRTDYRDFIAKYPETPVISHEIGQWCAYPNFDEIPKYTGYLKPKNFEIFRETLVAHHMGDQAREFVYASGRLQTLCYKEEIESALRTPGMGGFQLLDLHDFPGQGTALVGVLDPFWESKGYVTPEEYSRFCNSTVLLARLEKRVFTTDEELIAEIEVAHFGAAPFKEISVVWRLITGDSQTMAHGAFPEQSIPVGNGIRLGSVSIDLRHLPAPVRCKLIVALDGTPFENDWDIWIYPTESRTQIPAGITVTRDLDDNALSILESGGSVLLLIPPETVKGDKRGAVSLGFSSIFWNTAWTHGQMPHTLGILCNPAHPALAAFPTEGHSNWQWWYLVSRAGAMIMDGLPPALRPTVQVIDDWFTNRRLGLIFEGKIRCGKLLVCSMDLDNNMENNPPARQLFSSLLGYMSGKDFDPAIELQAEDVRAIYESKNGSRGESGAV